jgi:hypothetical protein
LSEMSVVMTQLSAREMPNPKATGASAEVVPSFVDALLGLLPNLGEPITALPGHGLKESPSSNLTDSGTAPNPNPLIQDQQTAKLQLSGLEDQRVQVPTDQAKAMLRVLPDSIMALLLGVPNRGEALPQPIELATRTVQDGNQPTLVELAAGLLGSNPDQGLGNPPVKNDRAKPPDEPLFAKFDGTFLWESVQSPVVSKDVAKALLGFIPDSILALLVGVPNSRAGLLQPIEPSVQSAPDGKLPNQSTGALFKAVDVSLLDLSLIGSVPDQALGSQSAKTDTATTQAQLGSKPANATPDQTAITLEELVNLVVGREVSKPLETRGGGQALRGNQAVPMKVARAPGGKPLNDQPSAKLEGTVMPSLLPQVGPVVSSPDVPPPMATTVDPEAVLRQVGRYLKVTLDGKHSEIRFQLHPDELGTVDVKVILHDGLVRAELTAQNSAVKAVLDSNLEQLRSRLSDQGLSVDQLNVTVGSDNLTGSRQQQEQQREGRRRVPWSSEENPEMAPDEAKQVWAAPRVDSSRRRINALV